MNRRPFFLLAILALVMLMHFTQIAYAQASSPTRGEPADSWADVEVGKRDFSEISAREIVPYKLFGPGGVVVDRSVSPGRMYVWDSGNNRILGVNLSTCYGGSPPCTADLVIGQPSASDRGACNLDSGFQTYPDRPEATASTICGVEESTFTVVEDKSYAGMAVDASGNLYVTDVNNHRVLKYLSPFTTDTVADEVWGQADFTEVYCNQTATPGDFSNGNTAPTSQTLCFSSVRSDGSGLALDAGGNLWVADGGNNRILRYPLSDGVISKTADLVLGQANFTSTTDGTALNKFYNPYGIAFGPSGELYVADAGNNRVLKFSSPFTTGMSGSTFGSGFSSPLGIEAVTGEGVFVVDGSQLKLSGFNGVSIQTFPFGGGGGSLGRDAEGNILAVTSVNNQDSGADVYKFTRNGSADYSYTTSLFSPPGGYNLTSTSRIDANGQGIAIAGDQLVIVNNASLLFWNDIDTLTNGKAYDGSISSLSLWPWQLSADASDRLWLVDSDVGPSQEEIIVYQAPLSSGQSPLQTIDVSTLPVVGGGTITLEHVTGIAPSPDGNYVWVAESSRDYNYSYGRVVRVKNPLTSPVVDVILGQTNLTDTQCNRGEVAEPGDGGNPPNADLDMLCRPGFLSLDREGNLFVSDHFHEARGNFRLLMFSADLFPPNPTTPIFAPDATKEFPRQTFDSGGFAVWETAFDSANHMVVGFNPYFGPRFLAYYEDPTAVNPLDPSDITYATPDGYLNDFYNWPVALTFDAQDNLYAYDPNRGQVRIYDEPFDTTSPSVTITAPNNGASYTVGNSVTITASASDNVGVTSVEFYVDSTLKGTDTSAPYSYVWNTTGVSTTTHALSAKAYDAVPNVGTSSSVSISITNRTSHSGGGGGGGSGSPLIALVTCAPGQLFSPLTGERCTTTAGAVFCDLGQLFSPLTGAPCTAFNSSGGAGGYAFGTITVRQGSTGEACKAWQMFFNNKAGAHLVTDGICGRLTIAVARAWQAAHGLNADGLLGAMSRAKANLQ